MTRPLDLDRFRALADAYGGVVGRWPEGDREGAARIAATREGAAELARASALDARLDTWRVAAPPSDLASRVAASGPSMTRQPAPRLRWWWTGVGLAAALAGGVAGTAAVAMVAPLDAAPGLGGTSFGDVGGTDG